MADNNVKGADLESELEARQQEQPESIRGVHEQVIKLVDNMVQNYIHNVRRTVQRMTNFIDNRRNRFLSNGNQPRESPQVDFNEGEFASITKSIESRIESLTKDMREFSIQWARVVGKQQSPLFDRIPPRGVELWRDFWDTVRKQVSRIRQEFRQLSLDMGRMLTGRIPVSTGPTPETVRPTANLLYSADQDTRLSKRFQEFYDKMSVALGEEQQKMDTLSLRFTQGQAITEKQSSLSNNNHYSQDDQVNNLIEEQDDQVTKDELTRNVALRQQIQQEINVFGSIFDIMRAFIQRLRESATNAVRDVMQPGSSANNDNNPVTPGPSVKPQVDQLLGETINSQRNINGQARPVLLPNNRPTVGSS